MSVYFENGGRGGRNQYRRYCVIILYFLKNVIIISTLLLSKVLHTMYYGFAINQENIHSIASLLCTLVKTNAVLMETGGCAPRSGPNNNNP